MTSSTDLPATSKIVSAKPSHGTEFRRLCAVMERNIRTLQLLQEKHTVEETVQDRLADRITELSGRMSFVYFHALWFGLWILVNTGRLGIHAFDPFPYGLLTMIVSLEAIFLSTFVLISQNRIAQQSENQAQLALQIALITEHEVTRVLKMLDAIQDKLGIDNDSDLELTELEQEIYPEDVLEEIVRIKSTHGDDTVGRL